MQGVKCESLKVIDLSDLLRACTLSTLTPLRRFPFGSVPLRLSLLTTGKIDSASSYSLPLSLSFFRALLMPSLQLPNYRRLHWLGWLPLLRWERGLHVPVKGGQPARTLFDFVLRLLVRSWASQLMSCSDQWRMLSVKIWRRILTTAKILGRSMSNPVRTDGHEMVRTEKAQRRGNGRGRTPTKTWSTLA